MKGQTMTAKTRQQVAAAMNNDILAGIANRIRVMEARADYHAIKGNDGRYEQASAEADRLITRFDTLRGQLNFARRTQGKVEI